MMQQLVMRPGMLRIVGIEHLAGIACARNLGQHVGGIRKDLIVEDRATDAAEAHAATLPERRVPLNGPVRFV